MDRAQPHRWTESQFVSTGYSALPHSCAVSESEWWAVLDWCWPHRRVEPQFISLNRIRPHFCETLPHCGASLCSRSNDCFSRPDHCLFTQGRFFSSRSEHCCSGLNYIFFGLYEWSFGQDDCLFSKALVCEIWRGCNLESLQCTLTQSLGLHRHWNID